MILIFVLGALTALSLAAVAVLFSWVRRLQRGLLAAANAVEGSGRAVDQVMAQAIAADAEASEYKAKWESQIGVIEQVIKEREDIWRLYQSACLGAGNAQRLLVERLGVQGSVLEGSRRLLEVAADRLSELDPDLSARCHRMALSRLPELSDEMKAFLSEYGAAADALPEKAPSPVPAALPSGVPPRIVSRETSAPTEGGGVGANP